MSEVDSGAGQRSRGRCCCGCLVAFAVLAVVAIAGVFIGPPMLRSMGLIEPDAEELFSGAPDPVATEAINDLLISAGVVGVEAVVVPIKGTQGQIAILTVDANAAAGQGTSTEEAELFLIDMMDQMVAANASGGFAIDHVAVDYLNESGESLLGIAAPQGAMEAYANGAISRREFLSQVEIDYSNLISADELRQLIEEAN